jgi:hypothetical protein
MRYFVLVFFQRSSCFVQEISPNRPLFCRQLLRRCYQFPLLLKNLLNLKLNMLPFLHHIGLLSFLCKLYSTFFGKFEVFHPGLLSTVFIFCSGNFS